jgi:hypothetical protein
VLELNEINSKIDEKTKIIGGSPACNPGLLAVENLREYDRVLHERYLSFNIPKCEIRRAKSFAKTSDLFNETRHALTGIEYSSGEEAYLKVIKSALKVVENTPQSASSDEWNHFLRDTESEDGDSFSSVIYGAGLIKAFLESANADEDGKYDYIWKQMRAALSYMIMGVLESLPGRKRFSLKNNTDYESFVKNMARKINNLITSEGEGQVIPPTLVSDALPYVENIINGGEFLDKILRDPVILEGNQKRLIKLDEYAGKRIPSKINRLKEASWKARVLMTGEVPNREDIEDLGAVVN